jgi:Tol biopolymer transport system component
MSLAHSTSFLDGSWGPILSRDGRTLLFTEVSDSIHANYTVYMRPIDGSAVVRLGEGAAMGMSPDGKWVLAITQAPQALVIYPTASGEGRTLEHGSLVGYREARWFPEGKRILVCGNEQGKAARCYVQGIDGGAPRAVTPDGEGGFVAPDGEKVVVWRPGDTPVIYRIDDGARQPIPSVSTDDRPIAWGADGQSVLFTTPGHVPGRIDRVDLRTGKREVVREFAPPDRTGMLQAVAHSVAADPNVYAYAYYRMRSTLFLVEGVR